MSTLDIQRDDKIQEIMDDIKPKLGRRIKSHIESSRFPYTYAYDFKRLGDGSRGGTGHCIDEQYGKDIEGYAKEIIMRAFRYIMNNYSEDFLWDILDETDGTFIRDNYNSILINYAKY